MHWTRSRTGGMSLLAVGLAVMLGAAPATPTYYQVSQRIEKARQALSGDGEQSTRAGDWNTFFDALAEELKAQGTAEDPKQRREHLDRIGRIRDALAVKNWGPANRLQVALSNWLSPRIAVDDAISGLRSSLDAGEGPGDGGSLKEQWSTYIDKLNDALRNYEGAGSVSDRLEAQRKLRGGLDSLRRVQAAHPWPAAYSLENALDRLLDQPNVQIVADANTVAPFLNQDPVKPEVIAFKGQVSYVQPGARTGFGLLQSDEGIAFYNGQYSFSTTPIQGFQQQIEQDPQGRRAANMYYFSATSYNTNLVMATAVVTPDGLLVYPQNQPSVSAAFGAAPIAGCGPGLTRFVAGLVGYNRQRILSEVQEQALPQIQQQTAEGTRELAAIKAGQEQARQNQMLRQYLIGNRTLRLQDYAITELDLSSSPWAAYVSGRVAVVRQWRAANWSRFRKAGGLGCSLRTASPWT